MLSYRDALAEILSHCAPLPAETTPLPQSTGKSLARELRALVDSPRFDCSAVDGYGVRAAYFQAASPAAPHELPVVGVVHAGEVCRAALPPRSAVKLMTGAAIPPGVDAVVLREHVRELPDAIVVDHAVEPGANIRLRGGDYRTGDLLAPAGSRIAPPLAALIAAQGLAEIAVQRAPVITLLTTGDELAASGAELAPGQIYDSNSAGLASAVQSLGLSVERAERCGDDLTELCAALRDQLSLADVVLCSGGVSVGDKDFVCEACAQLGLEIVFHGVALKPGKPLLFAVYGRPDGGRALFFGLPGNSVSALLCFERFVRPALLRLLGATDSRAGLAQARLTAALGKPAGRIEFVRAVASYVGAELAVTPLAARDSHMLAGLARANCLVLFPQDAQELRAGELVDIEWLYWA